MIRSCDFCGNKYTAEIRYINRGQGLFCSRSCGRRGTIKNLTPNTKCAYCDTPIYKNPSKMRASRSGLFFCSRTHKDLAQRIGGIKQIMPLHYGEVKSDYRSVAFSIYLNQCAICGWNEYPDVLEVNHKDLDRSNNNVENLEILCPTHHQVFHYLDKSGRWAPKNKGH